MPPRPEALSSWNLSSDSSVSSHKPNDAADLPASPQSSTSSSTAAAIPDLSLRTPQPIRATTTPTTTSSWTAGAVVPAADVMARQYPPPSREVTVEEMLARPPQKWSVGHYVKNAREARAPAPDKAQEEKGLADAKRELLAASQTIQQLPLGRR